MNLRWWEMTKLDHAAVDKINQKIESFKHKINIEFNQKRKMELTRERDDLQKHTRSNR